MRKILCILLSINCFFTAAAQNKTYTISGKISNIETGKVFLMAIGNEGKYYGRNSTLDSAEIISGKFRIRRVIYDNAPYAYVFNVRAGSIDAETGFVFIEPRDQTVVIDSISPYIAPAIMNSDVQAEIRNSYEPFFRSIVQTANTINGKLDDLYKKYGAAAPDDEKKKIENARQQMKYKADSLLYEYARMHKNSFVTLWKLIDRFSNNGFKEIYKATFHQLTGKVRTSKFGGQFRNSLVSAKTLAIDNIFPGLLVKDYFKNKLKLTVTKGQSNFTLIDFWFSNCTPCLLQFPEYQELYRQYDRRQLEIIGISTDPAKLFEQCKRVILERKITWQNYWDENGIVTGKLSIHAFPTNFLLNRNGEIIKRDITPVQLAAFLAEEGKKKIFFDDSSEPQ